jgi:O-antigen/teichoic acid export membrane protein
MSLIKLNKLKPYIYQLLGKVFPQIFGIAISVIVTKNAGIEVFGNYSIIIALSTLIYGVLISALRLAYQRSNIAEDINNVISFQLCFLILTFPIFIFVAIFFDINLYAVIFIFAGYFWLQVIETVVVKYRMLSIDIKSIAPRTIPVLIFVLLLYFTEASSLYWISILFLVSWSLTLLFTKKEFKKVKLNFSASVKKVQSLLLIWLSLILTQLYGNADLYIIKHFHGEEAVGIYKLSFTFASFLMPVAAVLSFIFLSKYSSAIQDGNVKSAKKLFKWQIGINLLLGFILVAFNSLALPYIAVLLYSEVGYEIITPAVFISIGMMFNVISMVFSYTFIAEKKEKVIFNITLASAIIFVISSFLLIHEYNVYGAAYAIILAHLSSVILYILASFFPRKIKG